MITYAEIEDIKGEAGNFLVKVKRKPRYVNIDKCTGCGDCSGVLIDEHHQPKEKDGLLWVDRIHIDEAACIHCGECARACLAENPENPALTNVAFKRLKEATSKDVVIEQPTLLQEIIRMSIEERKAFWKQQFTKCIKCYGCMEMCPVYIDAPDELNFDRWIRKGEVPPAYPDFHLLRAYHVLDTCVLCGECEATCPAGIPLKTLQDITQYFPPEEVFNLVPGLNPEVKEAIVNFTQKVRNQVRRMDYAI